MVSEKTMAERVLALMGRPNNIRNIGIIAHIHHGKTTLTDNLLAGAGMLSEELAGDAMFTWWHEQEREREMTIYGAAVSMVHEYEGDDYLINLIDTPGHVEFGGEVTRAVRAIDGAVVVVDFVDGIMPQTETVLKQALREYVKPVLFINKVDRAIKELQLPPNKIMERLAEIVVGVNDLIERYAPEEFKDKWKVSVQNGTVAFGSALHNWALSVPYMQKTGIGFKQIAEIYNTAADAKEIRRRVWEIAPLYRVVLDMVVRHLPSPKEAQKYRVPKLWHGDLNSKYGKAMLEADPNGPAVAVVTKVKTSKQETAIARVWSGTIRRGMEVWLLNANKKVRLQQVGVFKGIQKIQIEEAKAGNIIAISGVRDLQSGETIVEPEPDGSKPNIPPFEAIKHIFDPVVTKAIEPKDPRDLPKLIEVLKLIQKEDPTLKVEIDQESGQILISGLGDLHLEIVEYRIKNDFKVDIITSNPIVVYRESVKGQAGPVEGKSPNKLNKFYITVEKMPDELYWKLREKLLKGELPEGKIKKMNEDIIKHLMSLGFTREEAQRCKVIYRENMFFDMTRGIIHIGEVIDMVMDAFMQVMDHGPIAWEPCIGLIVKLTDAQLHEDAIHRGPGQVIPAVREAIKLAMKDAGLVLYEPVQVILVDVPPDYIGDVTALINSRRGAILDIQTEEDRALIKAKVPVREMIGFTDTLRSATSGRGVWYLVDQVYEPVPRELFDQIVREIRQRKGLPLDADIV